MFRIYDGRDYFYQWDIDRKIIVEDETITEVHFCNRTDDCSLICEVYSEGNLRIVNVPNILLQDNWRINVYAYDGSYTKHATKFEVKSRTKPADYIYTETELKNYDDLVARIEAIENGSGANIDLSEYATKDYVNQEIAEAQLGGAEIDLTDYATKGYVDDAIANIEVSGGSGLTSAQIIALENMFKVCAFIKDDVSAEYNAFKLAFGIADNGGSEEPEPDIPVEPDEPTITLVSISATYTGGNVAVGTNVNDLTGITVKATYSDGSVKNVTGYTLSGAIAEGNNIITVSYDDKTTTFIVTGVAESGGEETVQNMYVRNGEYLYGSPTDVTWGDNSLSYRMGTNSNGVYTHVGEAYHFEAGKTYTLFADMVDKADFVRVSYKTNDVNPYLGTQLGQLNYTDSYKMFTVPEDAKWVNLLFGLRVGADGAVAGDLGTWNNIAIYEGELTKRP